MPPTAPGVRRIDKRLQALGLTSYGAYLDHLEVDPDEFLRLFDSVLINVTTSSATPRPGATFERRSSRAPRGQGTVCWETRRSVDG